MNRLYRSTRNKMIAGVAAGMARYFNVDVNVVRLLWVFSLFAGGSGLLVYIIAAIIIPSDHDQPVSPEDGRDEGAPAAGRPGVNGETGQVREKRRRTAGLLLIVLGIILLAAQFIPYYFLRLTWPLLLIGIGLLVLYRGWQKGG